MHAEIAIFLKRSKAHGRVALSQFACQQLFCEAVVCRAAKVRFLASSSFLWFEPVLPSVGFFSLSSPSSFAISRFLNYFFDELDYSPVQQFCEVTIFAPKWIQTLGARPQTAVLTMYEPHWEAINVAVQWLVRCPFFFLSWKTGLQACLACRGSILFTGVGKSGFIAQKISQTLISTGTRAMYLNPTDALHGDLGIVSQDDLIVLLSKSGTTEELIRLVPFAKVTSICLLL